MRLDVKVQLPLNQGSLQEFLITLDLPQGLANPLYLIKGPNNNNEFPVHSAVMDRLLSN